MKGLQIALRTTDSRVTAIFLTGWILPIGGASVVEGLQSTGLPRLVSSKREFYLNYIFNETAVNLFFPYLREEEKIQFEAEVLSTFH